MTALPSQINAHGGAMAPRPDPLAVAVPLALSAGWTMALLHGSIPDPRSGGPSHLPTLHELAPGQRREVELARLDSVLGKLAAVPELNGSGLPSAVPAIPEALSDTKAGLTAVNYTILKALTSFPPEVELGYEVGRSLRDTANPPGAGQTRVDDLLRQLDRDRIAHIQEWLAALAAYLPKHSAAVVGVSLGRWSELASVAIGPSAKRRSGASADDELADRMCELLLRQGDVWLMLLVGTLSTAGLLGAEGFVAAAEAAVSRSAKIARGVLRRYWFAAAALLAALGGILFLTFAYTGGAATAWTSIAAIAGSLGVSVRSMTSAVTRLGEEAVLPVLEPAEEDAMAWAITTLPKVSLSRAGIRRLRRAGVPPGSGLGHA